MPSLHNCLHSMNPPMDKIYQAVIFDWDGTLIDSQAQIIGCMQAAFRYHDLQPPDASAIRYIIGLSIDKAISILAPELDFNKVNLLIDAYRSTAYAVRKPSSELFRGVKSCLAYLHQQDLHLAVATGKGRKGLDTALVSSGLQDYIIMSRCADETRSKPHPQMLEEILTDLNLKPDQAIMVGDTTYDIDMANNIGMDSVAVTYGMHDETVLRKSNPKHLINDINELKPLIVNNAI